MKRHFFKLACLFSMVFLFGCGDTEDTAIPTVPETDSLLRIEAYVEQLEALEIGIPSDWQKTKDPVERAAYARYLISIGRIAVSLDLNHIYTDEAVIQAEYFRAQLVRRFGDIPQVHLLADNELKNALGIIQTDAEKNAVIKAHTFLFPDAAILPIDAEQFPLLPRITYQEELAKIRKEDPEAWAEHNRARLIKLHGDIPDVHTVADFMRKVELGLPRTDADCRTYLTKISELTPEGVTSDEYYVTLEAEFQLGMNQTGLPRCRLEVFRKAKADGIPFDQIDWEKLNLDPEDCQKGQ